MSSREGLRGCTVCWGCSFSDGSFCSLYVRHTKGSGITMLSGCMDTYTYCTHTLTLIHKHTHTRDLRAWWTASIKAVQPGRAACTQPTVNNIQWLQTAHLVSRWASTSFYKMHSCNYIYNIHKNTKYSSINNTRKDLMICSLYSVVSLFDEPNWS